MSAANVPHPGADRNLLFGILALQLDFISRDTLIRAMSAWALEKTRPLGDILVEHKALPPERRALLEGLMQEHLKQHGDDPQQSLAAVTTVNSVRAELQQIADPDVLTSLGHVARDRPPADGLAAAEGPTTIGRPTSAGLRFRILRFHAEGGLGKVSVALDEELHREVALKEIKESHAADRESRTRFVREAEITGGLEHPGIVPVYGLGQYSDGKPFYAMRFIRGDSLKEAIAAFHRAEVAGRDAGERTLALRKLLGRFVDVCNAVAYAHSRGVLHRDLKPGNIMLGKYGETLVVDWGLAKAGSEAEREISEGPLRPNGSADTLVSLEGEALGTPAYMSPEQAAGQLDALGPATDIYSLGATLYCLLIGKPPFEGDLRVVFPRVQRGEFPPPRQVKASVPAALEAVCLKAMAWRPQDRYPSVRALADDLEHWLADEPVTTFPEPVLVRAGRWARRHRPQVAAAAALLLAALPLLTTLYLTTEAAREQLEAQQGKTKAALALATRKEEEAKQNAAAAEKSAIAARDSADQEKTAKEQAQKRLRHIEKANDLLAGIFADINPRLEEKGGPLLLEQLKSRLVEASAKLDGELIGDPRTLARLQHILGMTQMSLGSFESAIELLQKGRALCEQLLGPEDAETLRCMNNLATAYQQAGQLHKALPLFEQAVGQYKAKLGPDHPDTLTCMNNLALAYREAGQLDKALPLHEQTLEQQKAKLGPDHPETLRSMNNLAAVYRAVGQLDKALALLEQTLGKYKTKLGPDHPDTLLIMDNLAAAYQVVGQLNKALPLYEQTLEKFKAKLGPDHPLTLQSMAYLAGAYQAVGQPDKALRLYEQTLEKFKAKLGPDHPSTLTCMNDLAEAYREAGQPDMALPLHEQTLEKRKAKLGPDHPHTLASMNNLALAYQAVGQLDKALPLTEQTLEQQKAKLGPDHPDTLIGMGNLARVYQAVGQLDKALRLYEQTLEKFKAKLGPDHPITLTCMNDLAEAYRDAGQPDKALPLHEQTLEKRKAKLGPDHPHTLASMNNLALAYQAVGQLDKALPLYEQTLEKFKAKLGPDHPDTLQSMDNLAGAYQAVGQPDKALRLYEQTLEKAKTKLGPDHPLTLACMNALAEAYREAGQLDKALPLHEQTLEKRKAKLGPDHPHTLLSKGNLAFAYLAVNQLSKAMPLFQEFLAAKRKRLGADRPQYAADLVTIAQALLKHDAKKSEQLLRECLVIRLKHQPNAWTTFNAHAQLGASLLGQQRYVDAEPLLLKGYAGMKAREKTILPQGQPRLTEALERLVELYERWERPDDAARWRKELAARKKTQPLPQPK